MEDFERCMKGSSGYDAPESDLSDETLRNRHTCSLTASKVRKKLISPSNIESRKQGRSSDSRQSSFHLSSWGEEFLIPLRDKAYSHFNKTMCCQY